MSNIKCTVCGGVANYIYTPVGGDGRVVYHCDGCDTAFTFPMKSDNGKVKSNGYNAGFGNLRIGKDASVDRGIKFLEKHFGINPNDTIFDVGVNRGAFVRYLIGKVDTSVDGVEPDFSILFDQDLTGSGFAHINNARVVEKTIEEYEFQGNKYDLIYMSHTLEHVDDPVGVLKKLRGALARDGSIYIEVPNIEIIGDSTIVEEFFINKHRYHFSVASLVNTIELSGLSVSVIESDMDAICVLCEIGAGHASVKPTYSIKRLISKYRKMVEVNHSMVYKRVIELNDLIDRKRTVAWGAGRIFNLMKFRGLDVGKLERVVDTYMAGMEIDGVVVSSPSHILYGDNVIICSREYYDEIEKEVLAKGAIPHGWI